LKKRKEKSGRKIEAGNGMGKRNYKFCMLLCQKRTRRKVASGAGAVFPNNGNPVDDRKYTW
jgi:hypothetical protein